jgi:hypothetical protein
MEGPTEWKYKLVERSTGGIRIPYKWRAMERSAVDEQR